jgi:hypothetical protein
MSGSAKPNGLRDLEARIKSLPDQERLKRQRDLFLNTKTQAAERVNSVRAVLGQVSAMRVIDGKPRLLESEESACVSAVHARATELAALLGRPSPPSNTIGSHFDAIKRATTGLGTSVSTTWSTICRQYLDRADALMPLATRLSPNALAPLQALVQLLRSHPNAPTSPSAVQSFLTTIAQFDAAIQSMNIDGPVGRFLRDASTTGADPRALFDPEIKKYLDDNPQLWAALRVGLK